MLELPNFGHINTTTVKVESRDKTWWHHRNKLDAKTFILKYLYFKKTRAVMFGDIFKVVTMFIETIL